MAFGSSGSSRTVAYRDVEFRVNLGQFRANLGEAGELYARSTGQMSTESLRLTTKQYDVAKAVERYGAESIQAARKTIALREEMERLGAESARTAATVHRSAFAIDGTISSQERASGRFLRGGFVGSGVARSGLLFGSGAFVGGLAAVSGLKTVLDAAKREEVALGQLDVALQNTGNARLVYKRRIEEALAAQVKSTAFTNTELTTSLSVFIRRFGDVNQALRANAIAADVARAKNISLADAQTLILRASFGNPRSLRILGIELTKTTTNMDALKASTKHASAEQVAAAKAADLQANELAALDQVNAKYHGNAAKFLTTTAGKQALFNAELERSKEIIGAALLPEFNRMLTRLSEWLDKMNRTGKLQRDVNAIMKDATDVLHVLRKAVHDVEGVTGGFKHTLELLIALKLGSTFLGWERALRRFAAAAVVAETEVAAAGKAAAVAEGEIAAVGTASTVAAGETAALSGRLGALAALGTIDVPIVISIALAAGGAELLAKLERWAGKGFSGLPGGSNLNQGDSPASTWDPKTWSEDEKAAYAAQHGPATADFYRHHPDAEMRVIRAALAKRKTGPINTRAPFRGGGSVPAPTRKPPALVLGLTEAQQTDLLRAEGTKGTADDLRALNAQLGILNRLVVQKGLNAAQLNSLLQQRDSVLSQIDSITASSASKGDSARRKAQAAADRAFRHQESQLKTALQQAKNSGNVAKTEKALKELEQFYLKEARNPKLSQAVRDAARASDVALHKQADTIAGVLRHRESVLKLAVEKAKLTDGTLDDIAAVKKLEAFYKREANDPKLARALRDAFAAKDVAAKLTLKKLGVGEKSAFGKLEQEFLDAFTNIQASFGSNVKPDVHVHFHVPELTADKSRESRLARFAARSAWDQ